MQILDRRAARVLVLDAADRLLLFQGRDPADQAAGTYWFTPGGGLDDGETHPQGAARELREETGLRVEPATLGEAVHARVTEFGFDGRQYRQAEKYFLLRVGRLEVDTSGFNAIEVASVLGHRWWSVREMAATTERIYPPELLDVLARAA